MEDEIKYGQNVEVTFFGKKVIGTVIAKSRLGNFLVKMGVDGLSRGHKGAVSDKKWGHASDDLDSWWFSKSMLNPVAERKSAFRLGSRVYAEYKPLDVRITGTIIGKHSISGNYLVKADKVGEHEATLFHDGLSQQNKLEWGVFSNKRDSRFFREEDLVILHEEPQGAESPSSVDGAQKSEVFVRRFPSGAIRSDDRGREKPSFVSPYALTEIAKHFSKNASFFDGNDSGKNYMKGIKPIDIQDSLLRHANELQVALLPGKNDPAAVKEALVSIAANCIMGLHQIVMEEKGEYDEPFDSMEYQVKE